MTTLVTALVLASALAHASWNALIKGKRGDPLAASAGLCVAWTIVGVPLLFVVPPPHPDAWPHLAASIVIHLIYFCMLVAAYRRADLSFVYPIARGVPPILILALVWLIAGEEPGRIGVGGVLLVGVGVLGVGLSGKSESDSEKEPRKRPIGLALVIACAIATYSTIDGLGVREAETAVGYVVWMCTIQGALFASGALVFGGASIRRAVWERRRVGLIAGVLSAAGYGVALWAMRQSPIGPVAALRETSVVFAAIFGATFLKEPLGRSRIVAAFVVAVGVVFVKLGS